MESTGQALGCNSTAVQLAEAGAGGQNFATMGMSALLSKLITHSETWQIVLGRCHRSACSPGTRFGLTNADAEIGTAQITAAPAHQVVPYNLYTLMHSLAFTAA